jgi:hypothetical protein
LSTSLTLAFIATACLSLPLVYHHRLFIIPLVYHHRLFIIPLVYHHCLFITIARLSLSPVFHHCLFITTAFLHLGVSEGNMSCVEQFHGFVD